MTTEGVAGLQAAPVGGGWAGDAGEDGEGGSGAVVYEELMSYAESLRRGQPTWGDNAEEIRLRLPGPDELDQGKNLGRGQQAR